MATGRPTAWEREKAQMTWYEFACTYVDMKWKQASAKYRKDIARALTAATPAMLSEAHGRPDDASIRRAFVRWGFNTKQRADPPADVAEVLAWVARNSAPLSALAEPRPPEGCSTRPPSRLDGKPAAASTARRHRTILANAMDYAIELGLLETNPVRALKWTAPKVSSQVDRRSVVNPRQARALLDAVRASSRVGRGLSPSSQSCTTQGSVPRKPSTSAKTTSSCRPRSGTRTPAWRDPPDEEDWGELHLRTATPDAGSEWTDDGSPRETRQLKHRAEGDSRIVPTHPELTRLLRNHLAKFGTAPGRPPLRWRPGRRATHHHLQARLDQSAPGGPDCSRASLAARPAAI